MSKRISKPAADAKIAAVVPAPPTMHYVQFTDAATAGSGSSLTDAGRIIESLQAARSNLIVLRETILRAVGGSSESYLDADSAVAALDAIAGRMRLSVEL